MPEFNLSNIEWDENLIGLTCERDFDSPEIGETLKELFFVLNLNFQTIIKADGIIDILDYISESSDRILQVEPRSPLGIVQRGHVVLK